MNYRRSFIAALLLMAAGLQQTWAQKLVLYTTDKGAIEFDFADLDSISFSEESVPEDKWVDLGLPSGTLWATCNLGAESPEDYGYYFAWGETEPKDNYIWGTYKWMTAGKDDWNYINKYTFPDNQTDGCWYSGGEFVGDNKQDLDPEDDAATAILGSGWQMPTVEQIYELINNSYTKSEWTIQRGVYGRRVTSLSNGNSIFLPAAGWRSGTSTAGSGSTGYYWSNSLNGLSADYAFPLYFLADYWGVEHHDRFYGHPIRPVRVKEEPVVVPEYVDLGLPSGTLWATFNVGASKPEEYGEYFAWGETGPKSEYAFSNYKFLQDSKLTKYCTESTLGEQGNVDGKLYLDPVDDAATANWGSEWQTPTYEQQMELKTHTTITWTTLNGVKGMLLTSKQNGKTLFLPAAGGMYDTTLRYEGSKGYYWSSRVTINMSANSLCLSFDTSTTQDKWETSGWDSAGRNYGYPVRPVRVKEEVHEYVDLGLPSGTLWATCNVGARGMSEFGDYFAWGETSPKDEYTWDTYKYGSGENAITKYCDDSEYGTVDNKTELVPKDDAATANWGSEWQMPSEEQISELANEEYTTTTWEVKEGFYGRLITSKVNGKSIFLPAAGAWRGEEGVINARNGGYCWSRSLNKSSSSNGYIMIFSSETFDRWSIPRNFGLTVRPVQVKKAVREYVDLGLPSGTMWATCNVGAYSPEEQGDRFAWGETKPKEEYTWETYKYCEGSDSTMFKYCMNSKYGTVDGRIELRAEDDAAIANWGSEWQMPSWEQYEELIDGKYTTVELATVNGVKGKKITSKANGNSIFLPALTPWDDGDGNYGFFWSRTLHSVGNLAAGLFIFDSNTSSNLWMDARCDGMPVRAVRTKEVEHEYVDLGLPSHTQWATCNIGAACPEEYGDFFAWGETTPKRFYSWDNYKHCYGTETTLIKYCSDSSYGCDGYTDNKTQLESADDAATANWGYFWQLPSKAQFEELINPEYTSIEHTTQRGFDGLLITSLSNGNTIFLPHVPICYDETRLMLGTCQYLSRSLDTDNPTYNYVMFSSPSKTVVGPATRIIGHCARPVRITIN